MSTKHAVRLVLLVAFALFGAYVLIARPALQPESLTRDVAVRQAFGPEVPLETTPEAPIGALPPGEAGAVAPGYVDLRALPPLQAQPRTLLERWRAGEIDLERVEGPRSEAAVAALQEAAAGMPPSEEVQDADAAVPAAPTPSVSFDSLDYTECCAGGGSVPPDPDLAVGPDHIIAVVNIAFEIYDKSGATAFGPTTFAGFFAGTTGCNNATAALFDPNVLYDESADRYVIAIDKVNIVGSTISGGSYYCVGVSSTGDPTGGWYTYAFPMDISDPGDVWMDYPAAGIGRDALYMGGNMFATGLSNPFVESRVWAFNKSQMYAGQNTTPAERSVGVNFTPQPLFLHGYDQGTWPVAGPHYFLGQPDALNGSTHALLAWSNPFANPTPPLTLVTNIDMNAATGGNPGFPIDWPQLGGSAIQANDFRPLDFEFRNGYGWTTSAVSCNPGGGTVDCVRWAQINLSTGAVVNAGLYGSNGVYRTFPDLAVNHCNDMAIGYSRGSANSYPGAFVTGRLSTDAAGTLQGETTLKAGELTYTAFDTPPRRWGDYTGMTIDPDGERFWYLGQYSKDTGTTNGRWGTYIGSFRFASCTSPGVTPTPTPTASPTATTTPTATPTITPIPNALKINLPMIFRLATPAPPPSPTPTPQPTATATPGATGWVTITEQRFEGSFPGAWEIADLSSGGGDFMFGKRTCRPFAGAASGWGVGGGANGASLPCGSNYPNYAYSWLVYGPFSLADATAADLSFKMWLNSEQGYDGLSRMASIDGQNFYGLFASGQSGAWSDRVLDLADVYVLGSLLGQPNVWIAIIFESDGTITYPEGAHVDEVVLRKYLPGPGRPEHPAEPALVAPGDVPRHAVLPTN